MKDSKAGLLAGWLDQKGVQYDPRRMSNQKVSCYGPGHSRGDRRPSASVRLATGHYRCFGCGLSGDVYDLYADEHQTDFKTAYAALTGKEEEQASEWI